MSIANNRLAPYGFLRVAAVTPELRVADVAFNLKQHQQILEDAAKQSVRVVVFPELSLTGYSAADLFYQDALLDAARDALHELVKWSRTLPPMVIAVGLPWSTNGRLYNCAAIISDGEIRGLVPKIYLPTTGEFYEARWFARGDAAEIDSVELYGEQIPFGDDLLFEFNEKTSWKIGVELCEDLWAVIPPSSYQALAGASLILNLSASNEVLGKSSYRKQLVSQQSARCLAGYVYASSGPGESSTDIVYSGHGLIAENGHMLAEARDFSFESRILVADIDMQRLEHERLRNSSFSDAPREPLAYRSITLSDRTETDWPEYTPERKLSSTPFVPSDAERRAEHCREIFSIQAAGLAKRLRHTGVKTVTIGISGGLDSTLAVLVVAQAFDQLHLKRSDIVAVTMPGLGTTKRTRGNAEKLIELLGLQLRVIPIHDAVKQHFADIGHPEDQFDVTYENSQARERTQILMNVANQTGGLVVGTGDLSELALGWCTFNGDHMSMYHVNAGVPKTLVRYMVSWCADELFHGPVAAVLHDIVDTPISPELLPASETDEILQHTEAAIGPYELHDFFLFHVVRHGVPPAKVLFLATIAFASRYSRDQILSNLEVFYRRFFSQQFKRSAMPDGPKVGSVALSPRGDWRMPSDASAQLWLSQLAALKQS
jgi:NAD+ synthase (glutamine-hydrolysing)